MECDVSGVIRGGSFEQLDKIPNSIEINPITKPLQILKNGLECEHSEAHDRGGEAGHPHISTNIDKDPVSIAGLHPLQQALHRGRYIGAAEGLPLERADDVLVGLVRQGSEVGERVEEGELEALDGVGHHGVRLWGRQAVEGLDAPLPNRISEGFVGIRGLWGEVEEGEEEEGGGDEEEEVFGG